MTLESLNQENNKEIPVVPYSETWPKEGESDEEYALRSLALTRRIINGEIIRAEPTTEELSAEAEMAKQIEKPQKNEAIKPAEPKKVVYDPVQAQIDQMKSRKDLDY